MARLRLVRPAHAWLAAALGLALAGCSAAPGTAAVVDGERITVDDVNEAAADYEAISGQDVLPAAVAYSLVDARFINDVAADHGVAFSDAQVADFFAEQAAAAGGQMPADGLSDAFLELGRSLMISANLGAGESTETIVEDYSAARQAADVEMNPRYGQLVDGQLAPVTHEWLVGSGA
ncbi:hypothetical protein PU560_08995 [Georgenia sp. 10Sc9-8]|uniref:SurA N-terminal domain-containing protein n=1 Tax=Georgenia halotolerans TaxID=3028317 RepID=A0ABT5TWZ7_9MICO|nr:hypothetical protein [Georgenia halotolerans]